MQDGHEFTYVAQSSLEHMVILLSAGCATTPNQISLFFSQSRYVHLYQEDQQTERLLIECLICQEILNLVMVTTHASKKELTLWSWKSFVEQVQFGTFYKENQFKQLIKPLQSS